MTDQTTDAMSLVDVSEPESEELVTITIRREEAGDFVNLVLTMISASANHPKKYGTRDDHHIRQVLNALAETVKAGLHIRNLDEVPDILGDIVEFHQKFGLEYAGKPRALMGELGDFRLKFMREEIDEWEDAQVELSVALADHDDRRIRNGLELQLDALVDAVYVIVGTSYLQFGSKVFNEAWMRVHRANMAKVRAKRKEESKRGSTFDVVKPEGWVAPSHMDLVEDHAHQIERLQGTLNPGHESDTTIVSHKGTEV